SARWISPGHFFTCACRRGSKQFCGCNRPGNTSPALVSASLCAYYSSLWFSDCLTLYDLIPDSRTSIAGFSVPCCDYRAGGGVHVVDSGGFGDIPATDPSQWPAVAGCGCELGGAIDAFLDRSRY